MFTRLQKPGLMLIVTITPHSTRAFAFWVKIQCFNPDFHVPGRCLDKTRVAGGLIKEGLSEKNVLHPFPRWWRSQVITLLLAGKEASLKYSRHRPGRGWVAYIS